MGTTSAKKEWPLVRIIVPAVERISVYTRILRRTTSLAAVIIATAVSKVWGWRVEVIDENNYRKGPLGEDGLPDHRALQKENPATVVGFYCGLSSTIPRVWKLASFYESESVPTIAGSWHAHYMPEETLGHGIKLVVHGDGEAVIGKIISNAIGGSPLWHNVPGVSYMEDGKVWHNTLDLQRVADIPDQDERLTGIINHVSDLGDSPNPDFGLVRFANIRVYPMSRIRGCGKRCEFCSVRGAGRWAPAEHLFMAINWLVETRGAKEFFIVDDRLEEDIVGTIEFFRLIRQKYGRTLRFIVQMRLEAAGNALLLETLANAGVKAVCIGYESPVKDELKAMRKGLVPSEMVELTKTWIRFGFRIHAMFIVGYPLQNNATSASAKVLYKAYKTFVRQAGLRGHSAQFLIAGPVPGSDLRKRLEREERLILKGPSSWEHADGNFVAFRPIGMTPYELQMLSIKLMRWFYGPVALPRILLRLSTFAFDLLIRGWRRWRESWHRDKIRFGGFYLIRKWLKDREIQKFLKMIKEQG